MLLLVSFSLFNKRSGLQVKHNYSGFFLACENTLNTNYRNCYRTALQLQLLQKGLRGTQNQRN